MKYCKEMFKVAEIDFENNIIEVNIYQTISDIPENINTHNEESTSTITITVDKIITK